MGFLIFNFVFLILNSFHAQAATPAKLRVGYPSPSAAFYPLFATKEAGLLEKYGFDTEMVYVQGVKLVQVHVSGQLDISTVSSVVYLQASVGGADLIQVASSIDNQIMKLMVNPSIAKPQDLRGKTLAVTGFGSLTDLLLRPALKNWGLEPQKDVKLVQIGRMPDIAIAIAQKTVDGGMISFPTSVHAEKLNLKTLLDFAESGFESPASTVVVSRRYANANRDIVLRFLQGLHRRHQAASNRPRARHPRTAKIRRRHRPRHAGDRPTICSPRATSRRFPRSISKA